MLKTLEEPASFVHLILLTDRLTEVLPTISSRCQLVRFDAPRADRVAAAVAELGAGPDRRAARAPGSSLGDARPSRASSRASEGSRYAMPLRGSPGRRSPARPRRPSRGSRSWPRSGSGVRPSARSSRRAQDDELELYRSQGAQAGRPTSGSERIRRARRRAETGSLDLALQVVALWYADLAAIAWGAEELVRHRDRLEQLHADAGHDPQRLMAAVDLVEETRRRFQLNVSEELACEALAYRLEEELAG